MNNTLIRHLSRATALLLLTLDIASAQAPAAASTTATRPAGEGATRPATVGIGYETNFPAIKSGKWTGPRTPDGQPDVSGHWSNTIANHNNFEDPQGGSPGEPGRQGRLPRDQRAPSRVSDPADGKIPYQPWARAAQQDFAAHFTKPRDGADIEPLARCAPAGVPKSFTWHGYEIRQYPGYVLFLFNSGWRIIHLDGKPHLPGNIKLWNADSRGRWEGNTLVVDVTNSNSKALFDRYGNFASENVHITERYVFSPDNKRFNYVATFDDPAVYTRPWTATIPARRWTEADVVDGESTSGWHFQVEVAKHDGKGIVLDRHERMCVENNGAFGLTVATGG
jgi:hypothetical protein